MVTLSSLLVLGMVALLAIIVCICAIIGRRKPRLGWAILVASALGLTVLSGFASNPAKHIVHVYTTNTSLYLQDTVSLLAVWSSLYYRTTEPVIQIHKEDIVPLQFLPRTLGSMNSFANLTAPGATGQQVSIGDMRRWHAYGTAATVFDLEVLPDSAIRISNSHPTSFDTAWVIIDGMVHRLASVLQGTHDYDLDQGSSVRLGTFIADGYSQQAPADLQLIRAIRNVFHLSKGVWLIAAADEDRLIIEDIAQKVRDITLVIVHEEEHRREI